jgi:quercetin dioxygenase-like cupin family protein
VITSLADSALALESFELAGDARQLTDAECDTLLFVRSGGGSLEVADAVFTLAEGSAALVLAGEPAEVRGELELVRVTVGPVDDVHAALGPRETVVTLDRASALGALDARGYQVLFGPHNGSTRATLFAGFVPPGRSPWHYHLYDEIVWIPDGPAVLHRRGEEAQPLAPASAFRLRPRDVHIVENAGEREMTVLGVFAPAGSPSAAYLA